MTDKIENKTVADDCNFLLSTMDAKVWADEFHKRNSASDHGTMLSWFACAIMTGFDEANRRTARAAAPAKNVDAALMRHIVEHRDSGMSMHEYTRQAKAHIDSLLAAQVADAPADDCRKYCQREADEAAQAARTAAIELWNGTGAQLQKADDTLRSLSSYVGQGFCADTENLDYDEMEARIKAGIDAICKVEAARTASAAPEVPEGMVLVPIEPTHEIRIALNEMAINVAAYTRYDNDLEARLNEGYRNVLAASPQPEVAHDQGARDEGVPECWVCNGVGVEFDDFNRQTPCSNDNCSALRSQPEQPKGPAQ